MNKRKNVIQIFEHQTLRVGDHRKFTDSHFKALERYGYKTREKYYSVGNNRIKFSNYVGVIQVKNLTIEILPKADVSDSNDVKEKWQNALLSMLQECRLIKLDSISNARLKLKSASILDLYFESFLSETERLVRLGLIKSYRKVSENMGKVKGKIQFTEHVRRNCLHKEKFFVTHSVYDTNNLLNQILLKALIILSNISNNPSYYIRIKKLLADFEKVEETNITASSFASLRFNRNSERYKSAITLAKLIILKYSPDLKGGNENVLAILFDMNLLFENYVYRKLKRLEFDAEIPIKKVWEQKRSLFWETRNIRADILVETETGNFVIDTKWKILKEQRPSDSDLKQIFVYNLHYESDLSILLYPKTSLASAEKKPYKIFDDTYCQVAFADLFIYGKDGKVILNKSLGQKLYDELLKPEIEKSG